MKISPKIVALIFLFVNLIFVFGVEKVRASPLSQSQTDAIINLLRVFGADQEALDKVQFSLSGVLQVAPKSPIKVLNPNGGESLALGQTYQITWDAVNLPSNAVLSISLINATTSVLSKINAQFIEQNVASLQIYNSLARYISPSLTKLGYIGNSGSFNWIVPATLPIGSDYYIYIGEANKVGAGDTSDKSFKIASSSAPTQTIPLVKPTIAAERSPISSGETAVVTFTRQPESSAYWALKIECPSDAKITNECGQTFRFERGYDTKNFSFFARNETGANQTITVNIYAYDSSDKVLNSALAKVIVEPSAASKLSSVTVVYPNGREEFSNGPSGNIATIRWTTKNYQSPGINIDLVDNNGTVTSLARGISNTGSFVWQSDRSISAGIYKIRVFSSGGAEDSSDKFFSISFKFPAITATTTSSVSPKDSQSASIFEAIKKILKKIGL